MNRARSLLPATLFALALAVPASAEQVVCVRVKLEIPQKLTFERDAFEATLRLTNRLTDAPLEGVDIAVEFRALSAAAPADPIFVAAPTVSGLTGGIDGAGQIAAAQQGVIQWLLIPSPGAGGQSPGGLQYAVKATIQYQANGVIFETETFEEIITVRPQPDLSLRYFLPRHVRGDDPFTATVEPSVPFELGVRVRNVGYGPARNLQIESAQPRIVENEQGLLATFELVGTWRNAEIIPNTLSIPFGTLDPSRCGMGAWAMQTTYSGDFVELDVSFQHSEELGGDFTSLISSARSDWLIHRVVDDRAGQDAVFDALIDLNVSNDGVPERLLGSDCTDQAVSPRTGAAGGTPSSTNPYGTFSMPVTIGWNWGSALDPAGGTLPLLKVTRDRDGKELHPQNAWLDVDDSEQPIVAIFDHSSASGVTESYTLVYDLTEFDGTPPTTVIAPRQPYAWLDEATLFVSSTTVMLLSATDDAAGVAYSELAIDGGALEPNRPFYFSSGTHTVEFRSVDRKGNVEPTQTVTITVDDTAPDVTLTSPASGTSLREDVGFSVDFLVSDDNDPAPSVTAEIRRDDGSVALSVVDGQVVSPFALAPGSYTFVIEAVDFVENGGVFPATLEVLEKPAGPPRLVVTGLSDGQHVNQPVTLVVEVASDDPLASSTITLDGNPFVQGTVVAAEGQHVLHLDAEDAAGRVANEDFTFVVDMTPPTFTVLGVVPGRVYTTGVAPVANAHDEHLQDFEATLDGAPFVSGDVVASDGAHSLDLLATDQAGNEASRQVPFVVDLLAPVVTFSVEEGVLYTAPVAPVISITDATEVDSAAFLNGKAFLSGAPVGDGYHLLQADAQDATGKETHAEVRFRVDATPPRVRILGVSDGGVYAAGVSATLDVEEPNLVELLFLLDGATYVEGTPIVAEGVHVLSVTATDEAGHASAHEVVFSVDPDAPSIDIEGVEDGATYAGPVLPVITSDDPAASLTVLLNGAPWDGEAISDDGKHVLTVTATDAEGNESHVVVRFTIDTTPPAVVVTGVVDGGVYAGPVTPDVVEESEDIAVVSATLDGALFGLGGTITSEGEHTLVVTVVDEAGNQVQLTISFEIDPTAPALALLGVDDGAYRNVAVGVTVEAAADAEVTLLLDGQPYVPGDLIDDEGRHVVVASAVVGEREAVAGLTFTLDFSAPAITLRGVEEGGFYATAVSPEWSASDDYLDQVFAEVDGALVAEGALVEGEGGHSLVVTATDRAGNETVSTVTFTIDETAPSITISGVAEGAVLLPPVAAEVSVVDDNLAAATVSLDGASYASGAAIPPGDHVLDVKAVDLAGNLAQQSLAFRVEAPRRVSAILTREGVPAAGALAFLHETDGTSTGRSATADDGGVVTFEDVPDGSYRLRVHHGWQRHLTPALEVPGSTFSYAIPQEPEPLALLYVDVSANEGGDGSLDAPYARLSDALAVAGWGTTVKVAAGVYEEAGLVVREGVTVRGGYLPGAFAFSPAAAVVVVSGDGEGPVFTLDGVEHAVLADLTIKDGGGEEGGAVRSVDSSPLLRDLTLRGNRAARGSALFLDGGEHAHVANLLVTRNQGAEAVLVSGAPVVVEHVSVVRNDGDGLRHDGAGGTVLRGVFALNQGVGLISDDETVRAADCLSGDNGGAHFGGAFADDVESDGNRADAPVLRSGPLHAAYLAQVRGGEDEDSPGVDAASLAALALDLRGRTTAVTGAPDIGSADLGYHAWPAEPFLPADTLPPECGCSSTNDGLPPGALAALALFALGLSLRKRRRDAP